MCVCVFIRKERGDEKRDKREERGEGTRKKEEREYR